MAETLKELQADTCYWQRLLAFAGYAPGKADGIAGSKTRAATEAWLRDAESIRREQGGSDERTERNLATLIPEAQRTARLWLARAAGIAAAAGCDIRIICGTRTYAEQDALYARRPRVTRARGGQSMHNFGTAWDVGVFRGREYLGEHTLYTEIGRLHSQIPGLEWGGTWTRFVDLPHYQLNRYGSSTAARRRFEQ